MTRVAILNSRQTKTPVGNDPWVRQTVAAVKYAAAQGWTVMSSIGMNTWELVTWNVGPHGGCLELVVPAGPTENLIADFDLDPQRVTTHQIAAGTESRNPKSWWPERDRAIIERADIILPISLNPGGQLAMLLQQIRPDQIIDNRFTTAHRPQPHHERSLVDIDRLTDTMRAWSGDFIIHWTRSSHGPWPGETRAQFYSDMVGSGDRYCRSACDTLRRILDERTLRASSWRIAGATPMVAFTELSPVESIPLMRWRARWARWAFEPYGIAIRGDVAERIGTRAVRYVSAKQWRSLPGDERLFAHRIGMEPNLWPAEREWRVKGDVDLSAVPRDALRIIVRGCSETPAVACLTDGTVTSFIR
ncbi:MAG TPA: hypothetical protein VM118_00955 [Acidobacteriota bacterium]|nr:hypothetical protein [Acidobacteriota bacterium]